MRLVSHGQRSDWCAEIPCCRHESDHHRRFEPRAGHLELLQSLPPA
jgi:hypothetical protein